MDVKRGQKVDVVLRGGPFDGMTVQVHWGQSISLSGDTLSGEVVADATPASYGPARDGRAYTFRRMSKVVATLPAPGSAAA